MTSRLAPLLGPFGLGLGVGRLLDTLGLLGLGRLLGLLSLLDLGLLGLGQLLGLARLGGFLVLLTFVQVAGASGSFACFFAFLCIRIF